ncbi:LOW QUALITY PROTEIN: glycine betaine ABC transport system, glycine betaine-binding protein OpuAC [Geomicrobium sp. JCM 19037]|nr:LOW QUALITY PROTEIN: glycine betaine ABC transport system, glycine betaine-binding protein OpuAC [Geomicrobium sp. JCM 19037]
MKKLQTILAVGATAVLLTACGDDTDETTEENDGAETEENGEDNVEASDSEPAGGPISISHNNYAEGIVKAEFFRQVLEEIGYEPTTSLVEKAFLFSGLENEEIDLGISAWLPHTDQQFLSLDSDNIDTYEEGVMYEGTEMGLVVPEYMEDLNTIEDLNDYVDELDGIITGIDLGASLSDITQNEILDHYNLDDFTLQTSSEQAMIAELNSKYNNEEPIVVTLWSPHWTFGEYDMKYLEDPDLIYGEGDNMYYMTRPGLGDEDPGLIEFMNRVIFTDDQLSEMLVLFAELDDEQAAAEQWIEDNRDLVDEWIEG